MNVFPLIWILLISSMRLVFMNQSPFRLTMDYDEKQIIHRNFTITMELQRDLFLSVDCGENRNRLCLAELSLQIQTNSMLIDVWCEPPAFPFANFHPKQPVHTCILPAVNSTEQPSITMVVNSRDLGVIFSLATANFTYASQYNVDKQGETPIRIVVRIKLRNLSRTIG